MKRVSQSVSVGLLTALLLGFPVAGLAQTPAERLKAIEASIRRGRGARFDPPRTAVWCSLCRRRDVMADFHGSLDNPQLVLFASGNYFFALEEAVAKFGEVYPQYRGRVFF